MATKKLIVVLEVQEGTMMPDKDDFATYLGCVAGWPGTVDKDDSYTVTDFSVYDEQDLQELGVDGTLEDFEKYRIPYPRV